jgi:hypothetical protein
MCYWRTAATGQQPTSQEEKSAQLRRLFFNAPSSNAGGLLSSDQSLSNNPQIAMLTRRSISAR